MSGTKKTSAMSLAIAVAIALVAGCATTPVAPTTPCPEGYELGDGGRTCVPVARRTLDERCAYGHELDWRGDCVPVARAVRCDDGYERIGDECRPTALPTPCETGEVRLADGTCASATRPKCDVDCAHSHVRAMDSCECVSRCRSDQEWDSETSSCTCPKKRVESPLTGRCVTARQARSDAREEKRLQEAARKAEAEREARERATREATATREAERLRRIEERVAADREAERRRLVEERRRCEADPQYHWGEDGFGRLGCVRRCEDGAYWDGRFCVCPNPGDEYHSFFGKCVPRRSR